LPSLAKYNIIIIITFNVLEPYSTTGNCENEKEYYYEGDEQNYIIAQIDETSQGSTLISKIR